MGDDRHDAPSPHRDRLRDSDRDTIRVRLLALKFLLHLGGDLYQRLHAADDHDAVGNKKLVAAAELNSGNLSWVLGYRVVRQLGTDLCDVAGSLVGQISEQ
jgi:hypothetical protein